MRWKLLLAIALLATTSTVYAQHDDRHRQESPLSAVATDRTGKRADQHPREKPRFDTNGIRKCQPAWSDGVIQIRPLAPCRYDFLDDFNQAAEGTLVVR